MSKVKIPKVSQSKTIERVRENERPVKANITFRVSSELLRRFDKVCNKAKVKKVDVIEDLLKQFIDGNK